MRDMLPLPSATPQPDVPTSQMEEPRKFDSTGMFHWSPDHPIHEVIMVIAGNRHATQDKKQTCSPRQKADRTECVFNLFVNVPQLKP